MASNLISGLVPHPPLSKQSRVHTANNSSPSLISPDTPRHTLLEILRLLIAHHKARRVDPLISPDTLLKKIHLLLAHHRAQQVAPPVSPGTPSHCTSHIESTALTVQPSSRPRPSVRFTAKQGGMIPPPSDIRPSSPMSNRTRQRLMEARNHATYESLRTGRRVTIMDIILDSVPPAATVQPYRCAAKSYLPRVQKTYASKPTLGTVELYKLTQVAITLLVRREAYGRTAPNVSAERSTSRWPPNF
ncbi:hypothetical protein DFH29DRAFT_886248 [Suillus ampliporus]|nr:hypothetical protein DFH29DRAFT_886248 [Suillus ampliporus]